jgi:hypothetical protein
MFLHVTSHCLAIYGGAYPIEYSRDLAIEFWNQFDNIFLKEPIPKKVIDAYSVLFKEGFNHWLDLWRKSTRLGTYPKSFIDEISPLNKEKILVLADTQLEIMDLYFDGDLELERRAFEDFGQGVLFDDKHWRGGDNIHKMDSGDVNASPPIGYHRWHTFIQAIVYAGGNSDIWLNINRLVGLAWAIQSELKPPDGIPNNPELRSDRLNDLRTSWLKLSFEELNTAFEKYPFPDSPVLLDG